MSIDLISSLNTIAHCCGLAASVSRRSLAQMQRYMVNGDTKSATMCLERTIRWGVATPEVYAQHALLSVELGDLSKALRNYNYLVRCDTDSLLLCKRAAILIALKRPEAAAYDVVAAINAASFLWTNILYEMIRLLAPYEEAMRLLTVWSKINGDRERVAALIKALVIVEVDQARLAYFLAKFPEEGDTEEDAK